LKLRIQVSKIRGKRVKKPSHYRLNWSIIPSLNDIVK
jgi:hypothetical protein